MDKWLGKPDKINEVQWAKRGWVCTDKETVRCVACGVTIVIRLTSDTPIHNDEVEEAKKDNANEDSETEKEEEDWRADAFKELIERYARMITDSHASSCLWRRRGCDGMSYPPSNVISHASPKR